jgi:hypothetical protein
MLVGVGVAIGFLFADILVGVSAVSGVSGAVSAAMSVSRLPSSL